MTDALLQGFTATRWALMLAIAGASGLVHGFLGIGFPLLATPLFGLPFGWKLAVTLRVLPTLAVTGATLYAFHGEARLRDALRRYWPLPLTMPVGLVAGVWALYAVPASWLMLLMAGVIGVYLVLGRLGGAGFPALRSHPTLLAGPSGSPPGSARGRSTSRGRCC